ncbi:MAG TPA: cysteine desulfurase family protein [Candidatus Sulfotelmatobacter sp.]|jgi:cysteine desulfurase|nr:cysteine desulfurase family protein [Candidatus Sulfotelmatobacter sp.]
MIYFDYNATAPVIREAREAWLHVTEKLGGNPSSMHQYGAKGAIVLAEAREKLASYLGCQPADIIWTSGATEANNMVMHHFAKKLDPAKKIFVSAIEHPCVDDSSKHYFGKRLKTIPVTHEGVIDIEWLTQELAEEQPGLVAMMAANNETGIIQPWQEVQAMCQAYEVPFFTDAVQFIGKMPCKGLGDCDYVTGAAHKFGGPRGVGFLKIPHRSQITPLLLGGKQEGGRRAGTENTAIIAAMMAALEVREKQIHRSEHLLRKVWRDNFEAQFLRALPGATILGQNQPRLWNTVSTLMPDGDRKSQWVIRLDKEGFAVSTGSACTTGKEEPSHVLSAMGYKPAQAHRAVRMSAGWETNEADWDALLKAVAKVHEEVQHKG